MIFLNLYRLRSKKLKGIRHWEKYGMENRINLVEAKYKAKNFAIRKNTEKNIYQKLENKTDFLEAFF